MTTRHILVQDIAAPRKGSIAIGPFGSRLRADQYTESGIPVVRGQNITESARLDETNLVFVSPETALDFPFCMLEEEDIVFPHRGAIGRVGIVDHAPMLLSSSMMKLSCARNIAEPRFIFYYFRGPGKTELLKRASTVGTPGIGQPLSSLRSIPVMLPSLANQRAIAEVLGALDDKIVANTKLDQAADEYLDARLQQMLANEPTERAPLRNVAAVNSRSVKPGEGNIRYIDIASIGTGTLQYPALTPWDDAPSRARRSVAKKDILWSTVRPARRAHWLNLDDDPRLIASTGIAVISPRDVGFAYLYQVLKRPGFTEYLVSVAQGSAYPAVRPDRILDASIPLLSTPARRRFEELAVPLREYCHQLAQESRTLAELRDTLLPPLMSGRLRVKDAEKTVGDVV